MSNKKLMDFDLHMFGARTPVDATEANTHLSKNFGELLEPGLRKIFFETYDEAPEQYSKIYNVKTSTKAQEREWGMGAFGDWTKRADELDLVDYAKVSPGDARTYTHESFTKGFKIGRELMDDELYEEIKKMPKSLARAGRATVEKDAASTFLNGFTKVGYDGSPLFAKDHKLLDSTKKCSNLIEGELNRENLDKAILMMRETTDEAGNLVQFKPDTLIVPPALEDTAIRLLQSSKVPGSELNDTNNYLEKRGIEIFVYDFIGKASGGSDTHWFLQDSKRHELSFYWRIKPEFKRGETFDDLSSSYRGYMRYCYGWSDFRGIIGSQGLPVSEASTKTVK